MFNPETLIDNLKSSKKYKFLATETIRHVVLQEFEKFKTDRDAEKKIRAKLHLILASYLSDVDSRRAEKEIIAAFDTASPEAIKEALLNTMSRHASTRERIPSLDEFYPRLFAVTGMPASVADLACAVNPLSYRWMNLPAGVKYHAYDINEKIVGLLNFYFQLEDIQPPAEMRDILCRPPEIVFDVALFFKMYHCLEHRQKGAGWTVVENTPAKWMAVSFPTQTLVNRKTDIFRNYSDFLFKKIKENGWEHEILEFKTELILLVNKKACRT